MPRSIANHQIIYRWKIVDRINEDIESGLHSGVTAAPALFINNIRYAGRWKMTQLMTAIIATSH